MKLAAGVVLCAALFVGLGFIFMNGNALPRLASASHELRVVLWEYRALDLVGQLLIILGGAFGVLVLTKERIEN